MPMYDAAIDKAYQADNSISAAVQHHPTVTEQLLYKKAFHEAELARINAALEQAKNNAPTMHLLDAIAKVGLGR